MNSKNFSNSTQSSKKEYLLNVKQQFYEELKKQKEEFKPTKELSSHSTIPIITEKHYPQVSAMQVTNKDVEASQFNQNTFVKEGYETIVSQKAKSIVGISKPQHKTTTTNTFNSELQELYSSKKAVESEHIFEEEIKIGKVLSSKLAGLLGNSSPLLKIQTHDNISISKHIETHQTGETKAKEAILELYYKGFDDNQIRSLLSLGSFGKEANKVLVPTKWGISACDSVIEQDLYSKIKSKPLINKYEIFEHYDKGNHFMICFLPEYFCSEVVESWPEGSGWALERDFVKNNNKLQTKEPECAGGYYATKLAMFEHLYNKNKQAACISIRIIDGYDLPLGVIFVRECAREAIKKGPIFSTNSFEEFSFCIQTKFPIHNQFFKNSPLLKEIKEFKNLNNWI